jgi:heterodisulfide reductase subunit B
MDLAYYPGCSLYQSAKLYNHQTKLVFAILDLKLKELEDWSCCGATSAGKINDFMAVALPARNLGIAESSGLAELVIPCSACYSRTKVAQKQLEDFPLLKNEINIELSHKVKGGIKVSSALEVLNKAISGSKFKSMSLRKLEGYNPACYYGCMNTRFPYDVPIADNVENPQAMERP